MKKLSTKITLSLTNFFSALCEALYGLREKEKQEWCDEVDRLEKIINEN